MTSMLNPETMTEQPLLYITLSYNMTLSSLACINFEIQFNCEDYIQMTYFGF